MNFYKLYALLLVVALVFPAAAAGQTPTPDEKREASLPPETEQAAIKLLSEIARETQQFKLPENRVRAQIVVADLLWKADEQAARSTFQNAFGDLQNLFANINLPEGVELSSAERSKYYNLRYKLAELRKDYVLTLAARDSQSALNALAALKVKLFQEYDPLATDELELQVTAVIVKNDPDKTYTVARQQLDANGVNYQFIQALQILHKKDSLLAANLGKDVIAKLKSLKIRVPSITATNSTPPDPKTEIDFWQVASFTTAASEMNRTAALAKSKKVVPLLSDAEMKELVEITAGAFLAAGNPMQYSIIQVMPEIMRYSPAAAQRIRLKLDDEMAKQLDKFVESNAYNIATRDKSAAEMAKLADGLAPEARDPRYSEAATRALAENDPETARMIAARIKERKNYTYLFEQIDAAIPLGKARRGDLAEVRKMLATLKTNGERVATLTELAAALAAKGDKEAAAALLDESLQMMPALIRKAPDLESAWKIAGVYSIAAPERSFTLIENGIAQMNEVINSGIRLDEFYDAGAVETDELLFKSMSTQGLMHLPNSTGLIRNLARADFERTVRLADKFERPEIRLFVRLRIAHALLDSRATEKEKTEREQLAGDEDI